MHTPAYTRAYILMHAHTHTNPMRLGLADKSANILNMEMYHGSISGDTGEGKIKLKSQCHYLANMKRVMDPPLSADATD